MIERRLIGANGKVVIEYYHAGTDPLPDFLYKAYSTDGTHFTNVGEPFIVTGKEVGEEMDKARSIKGHEPQDLALRKARKLYPDKNIVGVSRIKVILSGNASESKIKNKKGVK